MRAAKRGGVFQTVPAPSLAVPPVQSALYMFWRVAHCRAAGPTCAVLTLLAPSNV